MVRYRAGRTTVALSLIALGGAALADNLLASDYTSLVLRLWPLLLVGVGLEYLVAGWIAENRHNQRPGLAWGRVILILVLGLVVGGVRDVHVRGLDFTRFGMHLGIGPEAWADREQIVDAKGINKIDVSINVGKVELLPSSDDQIHVQAHYNMIGRTQTEADQMALDATRFDLGITTAGDQVRIHPEWRDTMKGAVELTIAIPNGLNVHVNSGAGKIQLSRLQGDVNLDSSVGEVEVEDCKGSLTISTGAGAINVNRFRGPMQLDTYTGTLTAEDVQGDATLSTSTGRIDLRSYQGGQLKAEAKTGAISVEYAQSPTADADINSQVGKVVLTLPSEANAKISATSSTGSIHGPEWLHIDRQTTGASASGVLGTGLHTIVLHTGVGSIEVAGP